MNRLRVFYQPAFLRRPEAGAAGVHWRAESPGPPPSCLLGSTREGRQPAGTSQSPECTTATFCLRFLQTPRESDGQVGPQENKSGCSLVVELSNNVETSEAWRWRTEPNNSSLLGYLLSPAICCWCLASIIFCLLPTHAYHNCRITTIHGCYYIYIKALTNIFNVTQNFFS